MIDWVTVCCRIANEQIFFCNLVGFLASAQLTILDKNKTYTTMMILNILGLHIDNNVRPKQTTIFTKKKKASKKQKWQTRIQKLTITQYINSGMYNYQSTLKVYYQKWTKQERFKVCNVCIWSWYIAAQVGEIYNF